jgi:hypothetical protein
MFIIYPYKLVTTCFKKIWFLLKKIGVACRAGNMSIAIVKYTNFSLTCSVTSELYIYIYIWNDNSERKVKPTKKVTT